MNGCNPATYLATSRFSLQEILADHGPPFGIPGCFLGSSSTAPGKGGASEGAVTLGGARALPVEWPDNRSLGELAQGTTSWPAVFICGFTSLASKQFYCVLNDGGNSWFTE